MNVFVIKKALNWNLPKGCYCKDGDAILFWTEIHFDFYMFCEDDNDFYAWSSETKSFYGSWEEGALVFDFGEMIYRVDIKGLDMNQFCKQADDYFLSSSNLQD